MTKGNATEPGGEKGVSGVAAAGWKGGWWTGAVFGSVWLAVIGVRSSRSPAVMVDRMTLSTFTLPSIVCACMSKWRHAHFRGVGEIQLVTETLTMSKGPVWACSQGGNVTVSRCSILCIVFNPGCFNSCLKDEARSSFISGSRSLNSKIKACVPKRYHEGEKRRSIWSIFCSWSEFIQPLLSCFTLIWAALTENTRSKFCWHESPPASPKLWLLILSDLHGVTIPNQETLDRHLQKVLSCSLCILFKCTWNHLASVAEAWRAQSSL